MPCLFFHQCQGCNTLLHPKKGDGCVFCSYGTVPCPPIQEARQTGQPPSCC
ncbi:MAG: GDCCVxC domain-containing (seleno)protein [Geminicoccaceae bacterium]